MMLTKITIIHCLNVMLTLSNVYFFQLNYKLNSMLSYLEAVKLAMSMVLAFRLACMTLVFPTATIIGSSIVS